MKNLHFDTFLTENLKFGKKFKRKSKFLTNFAQKIDFFDRKPKIWTNWDKF